MILTFLVQKSTWFLFIIVSYNIALLELVYSVLYIIQYTLKHCIYFLNIKHKYIHTFIFSINLGFFIIIIVNLIN